MNEAQKTDSTEDLFEKILKTRMMPSDEEWTRIYQCAESDDECERYDAAEALGIRCDAEDEKLLCQMTYDKNWLVKVSAIEALENGRQKKTLTRLFQLMRRGGTIVRGYSVQAYFEIWINRYGYTKPSVEMFWKKVESRYRREEDLWVRSAYEKCRYISGDEEALLNLKQIILDAQDNHRTQTAAFHGLTYVCNVFNEKIIKQIVMDVYPYINVTFGLKREMEDFLKRKEVPKILFLDQENAALAQILRYLSADMENDMWVETAGLNPAEKTKEEVRKSVGESEIFNRYYYPINLRSVWIYDYIVPLGIKINMENYPFQKIVPLFEDVDENMLDVEKAKKMLDDLKLYIDKDM